MTTSGTTDDNAILPSRRVPLWRRSPRAFGAGAAAAVLLVGGIGIALAAGGGGNDDPAAGGTTTALSAGGTAPDGSDATTTTRDRSTTTATGDAGSTPTWPGATTTPGGSTATTAGGSVTTVPGGSTDTTFDSTNATSPSTTPPAPSTTAPDTRTPVQAYIEEFTGYCNWVWSLSPDGNLYDPEFPDDVYVVSDCLDWLDDEGGTFYDTAPEAAEAGIEDAILTIEDLTFDYRLCWIDPGTEQFGGCWVSPY